MFVECVILFGIKIIINAHLICTQNNIIIMSILRMSYLVGGFISLIYFKILPWLLLIAFIWDIYVVLGYRLIMCTIHFFGKYDLVIIVRYDAYSCFPI